MNPKVERYITRLPLPQRTLARRLARIIWRATPRAAEDYKRSTPWYLHHGMFCYFRANKYHITFGFSQGVQLADPLRLTEGAGKGMRHVKIREAADIRPRVFAGWIKQAMAINHLKRKTKP
jgi:hypothetical protein